jgi:Conserved oligomeric complex COG6
VSYLAVHVVIQVLVAFLDPLLQACRQSSEGLGLSDTAVFMLNNIVEMQAALTPYDFTAPWVHRLTNEMQQWEDTLVREEAQDILSRVGVSAKLRAIQSHGGDVSRVTVALFWLGCLD